MKKTGWCCVDAMGDAHLWTVSGEKATSVCGLTVKRAELAGYGSQCEACAATTEEVSMMEPPQEKKTRSRKSSSSKAD